jgi:hypothetical protein
VYNGADGARTFLKDWTMRRTAIEVTPPRAGTGGCSPATACRSKATDPVECSLRLTVRDAGSRMTEFDPAEALARDCRSSLSLLQAVTIDRDAPREQSCPRLHCSRSVRPSRRHPPPRAGAEDAVWTCTAHGATPRPRSTSSRSTTSARIDNRISAYIRSGRAPRAERSRGPGRPDGADASCGLDNAKAGETSARRSSCAAGYIRRDRRRSEPRPATPSTPTPG